MRAAHWIQLENPIEFNKALREWLETLPSSLTGDFDDNALEKSEHTAQAHLADEL